LNAAEIEKKIKETDIFRGILCLEDKNALERDVSSLCEMAHHVLKMELPILF
jgi:hypothetical protein